MEEIGQRSGGRFRQLHRPVRYYEYVSDTKLDQLVGQIPAKPLARLAAELTIDVKVLSATVSLKPADDTRYSRLRVVEEYLERHEEVTGVEDPAIWFRGEVAMRSLTVDRLNNGLVLFGGTDGRTVVALIGSARHLIGSTSTREGFEYGSRLPSLFSLLRHDDKEWRSWLTSRKHEYGPLPPKSERSDSDALKQVADFVDRALSGPVQQYEFLAHRLLRGPLADRAGRNTDVVVGTPLYIALSSHG